MRPSACKIFAGVVTLLRGTELVMLVNKMEMSGVWHVVNFVKGSLSAQTMTVFFVFFS